MNLSEAQMRKIETESLKKRIREMELREIDYRQVIINLRSENAELKKRFDTLKCDILRKEKTEVHLAKNKSQKEFIEKIKEEYNLENNWGYDPESGEIKQED